MRVSAGGAAARCLTKGVRARRPPLPFPTSHSSPCNAAVGASFTDAPFQLADLAYYSSVNTVQERVARLAVYHVVSWFGPQNVASW